MTVYTEFMPSSSSLQFEIKASFPAFPSFQPLSYWDIAGGKDEMIFEIYDYSSDYLPPNGPPLIDGIQDYYEVEAEKMSIINLGELSDPEGLETMIESWKIEQGTVTWIQLRQDVLDTAIEHVDLEMTPPKEVIDSIYTLTLIIVDREDLSAVDIEQTEYSITLKIIGLNETSLNETSHNGTETELGDRISTVESNKYAIEIDDTQDIVEAHMNAPSLYGGVVIEFTDDIEFPADIEQWSSENIGTNYIEITYLPSTESEIFFEEADLKVNMTWKVVAVEADKITLKLNFTSPLAVSTNPYDID